MPDLSVEAISVAVHRHPGYRPVAALAPTEDLPLLVADVARFSGIPPERLWLLDPDDGPAADVATPALAALGAPATDEPLFLVRSGPPRDPYAVELARLVHEAGWAGEDVGVTHLDELGGTVIFRLLSWVVPEGATATVVICDDPLFTDAAHGSRPIAAVGVRVRRGPGPLRVLGCGEGAPTGTVAGDSRFAGAGPCDGWLALHAALRSGRVTDGDRMLLHTRGPAREGWLSMVAVDTEGLLLAGASPASATESAHLAASTGGPSSIEGL
jgi:hypothetical protein